MPKPNTFPTLIDELKTISISFLTKNNYLKPHQLKSGTINWSINDNKIASISIRVNTQIENHYLDLSYKCNEAPINYRVQLVSAPSNLGKGVVWCFVCPYTGKRCRKLYLSNKYFYHRSAFIGCMYEKQTLSKKSRFFKKTIGLYFQLDQLNVQINKKHFKKQYAGKPTKKYLVLLKQIQKAECLTNAEIQKALNF